MPDTNSDYDNDDDGDKGEPEWFKRVFYVKPLSEYDDEDGITPAASPALTLQLASPVLNGHLPEPLRRYMGGLPFDDLTPGTKLSLYRRYEAGEFNTPAAQEAQASLSLADFQALPPEERLRASRKVDMQAGVSRTSTLAADKRTAEARASLHPRWAAAGGIERHQLVNAEGRKLTAEREVKKLSDALPSLSGALRSSTEARIAFLKKNAGL